MVSDTELFDKYTEIAQLAGNALFMQEMILLNIEDAEKMLAKDDFRFVHLPDNLRNKECCEAYILGMRFGLMQRDKFKEKAFNQELKG